MSTVDALVEAISEEIFNGDLKPGSALREVELASRFRVGRYSIRAAIQRLVAEGIVRHEAHHGAMVARFSTDDVRDVYLVRICLELEAARLLCEQPGRLAAVRTKMEALATLGESSSWEETMLADLEVHRALVDAIGSPRASEVFGALGSQLRLCLGQLSDRDRRRSVVVKEHQAFLDEIAAGNESSATELLRAHLEEAARDAVEGLEAALGPEPRRPSLSS